MGREEPYKLTRENSWISPHLAIDIWLYSLEVYGEEACLKKAAFKSYREQYISALFALGIAQAIPKLFWLRFNLDGTTPDAYLFALTHRLVDNWDAKISALEIFEWEAHSEHTLLQAIKNKLFNKQYPANFTLLCYIHDKATEMDILEISKQLQTIKTSIGEIWLLANIDNQKHESDYHGITQLYPRLDAMYFNALAEFEKSKKQPEFITKIRDTYFLGSKTCECKNCYSSFLERLPLFENQIRQTMTSELLVI